MGVKYILCKILNMKNTTVQTENSDDPYIKKKIKFNVNNYLEHIYNNTCFCQFQLHEIMLIFNTL
jgi:hypothetical protein